MLHITLSFNRNVCNSAAVPDSASAHSELQLSKLSETAARAMIRPVLCVLALCLAVHARNQNKAAENALSPLDSGLDDDLLDLTDMPPSFAPIPQRTAGAFSPSSGFPSFVEQQQQIQQPFAPQAPAFLQQQQSGPFDAAPFAASVNPLSAFSNLPQPNVWNNPSFAPPVQQQPTLQFPARFDGGSQRAQLSSLPGAREPIYPPLRASQPAADEMRMRAVKSGAGTNNAPAVASPDQNAADEPVQGAAPPAAATQPAAASATASAGAQVEPAAVLPAGKQPASSGDSRKSDSESSDDGGDDESKKLSKAIKAINVRGSPVAVLQKRHCSLRRRTS